MAIRTFDLALDGLAIRTTHDQDRCLARRATRNFSNRRQTFAQLTTSFNQANTVEISTRTARRRLREKGVQSCVPKKVPVTDEQSRAARLTYCREMSELNDFMLNNIVYSDECRISLNGPDSFTRIWRRPEEHFDPNCTNPTPQNQPGLMVWSCCSPSGLRPIIILDGHINGQAYRELLERSLRPTIGAMFTHPRQALFQQDNAS